MAITGAPVRFPAGGRIFNYEISDRRNSEISDELAVSSLDSVFGFLDVPVESAARGDGYQEIDEMFEGEEEDGENCSGGSLEEKKVFWKNQHDILQATMCRTTSLETGIRNVTKGALKELLQEQVNSYCKCGKAVAGNNCRSCLMREICCRLQNAGYNCRICRTKWRSSPDIPSGEHTFLDVINNSSSKREEKIRVIIELNLRAYFEMARASDEYNQLVNCLPEVYVGKAERLRALITIMCASAKKCMKGKKMHIGPWRKQKYMLAKWFTTNCERLIMEDKEANPPLIRDYYSNQIVKPARGASMLTMALLDTPRNALVVV